MMRGSSGEILGERQSSTTYLLDLYCIQVQYGYVQFLNYAKYCFSYVDSLRFEYLQWNREDLPFSNEILLYFIL